MHSLNRILHDAYATWMTSLRGVPPICEKLSPTTVFQDAGETSLDQSLEAAFYGYSGKVRKYHWAAARLYDLRKVQVVGDQGNIFLEDGRFLQICPSLRRLERKKIRRPISSLSKKISGTVFHLTGRDHENHGHFLSQYAPRILAAREWLERQGDYRILVAPKHAKWQSRYLRVLGFDVERIIEGGEGTLSIERLIYVPMWYDDSFLAKPEMYGMIADAFENFAKSNGISTEKTGRPLFVTRKDAPNKRLLNEDEIIEICRAELRDIEVVDLAKLTFIEQVEKFSKAPWIIGAQGQGLTNLLFCKNSRVVILEAGKELMGNEGWCMGYRDMALACKHQAIRLISGEERVENLNWIYRAEKFKTDFTRLASLLK